MTKRNVLLAFALLLISFGASAQCVQSPQILGRGYQGGSPCWGGQPQQQFVQPQQRFVQPAMPIQQNRGIPPNCRLVQKPLWDRVTSGAKSGIIDAVIGGLLGAGLDQARHTGGQWTNVGLAAGGALGFAQGSAEEVALICMEPPQGGGYVQQGQGGYIQQGQDQSYGNRPQPVQNASRCQIDGAPSNLQDLRGLSEEQCAAVRDLLIKNVPGEVRRESVPADRPVAPGEVDLWKWRVGTASATSPGKCVVERLTGEPKPAFCSELKELPRLEGETRQNWRMRAEKA